MGFGTRLRNGLAKLLSNDIDTRRYHNKSLNINLVKDTMNSSLLSEMVPGLSQPVWGPTINSVGAYSREGYTSKTLDTPAIPFSTQALALQVDEDVQLIINRLSSQVTGGEHYIKTATQELTDYLEEFSQRPYV